MNKLEAMLAVLGDVYAEGGLPAALAKVNKWQENGWLYPHERRLLLDSVSLNVEKFPPMPSCPSDGIHYYSECISLSQFYDEV